jgi:hypothetical protein
MIARIKREAVHKWAEDKFASGELAASLRRVATGVARHAANTLKVKGRLGEREYYAHAFAVWLFSQCGEEFDEARRTALNLVHAGGDQLHPSLPTKFHWEFVRFALQHAHKIGGLDPFANPRALLGREGFAYTRVANWTMLRAAVRLASGSPVQTLLSHIERGAALAIFQRSSGLIEDTLGSPTAQYHAFSTALLALQLETSATARWLHTRQFVRAVTVLENLTFPSGEMNVLGRGQCQSFGYAAATLAYIMAARITGEMRHLDNARRVFGRIDRLQRSDGSLPLVVRDDESCSGELVDLADPKFLGWYCYNNYYDYMMFTGALLAHSATKVASSLPQGAPRKLYSSPPLARSDSVVDGIRIVAAGRYRALVAPPGRVLSDGMAIPYIETDGEPLLPCYGGETYGTALHKPEDLPLPCIITAEGRSKVFFQPGAYRWISSDAFFGASKGWSLTRRIQFSSSGFRVDDLIQLGTISPGTQLCAPRLLLFTGSYEQLEPNLLKVGSLTIRSSSALVAETEARWCARGRLTALSGIFPLERCRPSSIETWLEFKLNP